MNQASSLYRLSQDLSKNFSGLRTIAITSGKGGVGKTNVVVNLASALAKKQTRVAILDADYGLGNIDILLGLDPKHDISDLLNKKTKLEDVLIQKNGIHIIPASSGIQSLSSLSEQQEFILHQELKKLEEKADVLLVDTAAGISDNVISLLLFANEIFLVVSPEPTSIVDAYAVIKVLTELDPFKQFSVITNMVRNDKESSELFLKLSKAVLKFLNKEIGFLGSIRYDQKLVEAVRYQTPVIEKYPTCQSSRDFNKLALGLKDKFKKKK